MFRDGLRKRSFRLIRQGDILKLIRTRCKYLPCGSGLKVAILVLICGFAALRGRAAERLEFTRMLAHWSGYASPEYLSFVDEAKPEVAQVGFYGAHFWSLVDTPFGGGYP